MDRLKDKTVIVTGGSLGIGRETCIKLAEEGAWVAITDILDAEGHELADGIKKYGGQAQYWHLDVSAEDQVKKVFSAIHQEFGAIDVLVNNAGISGINKPTHQIALEDWQKVIDIAYGIVFLASEESKFMTGSELVIDGGYICQ